MEWEELKQLSILITKFKDSIYETDSTGSPAVSVNHAANVVGMTKEERQAIIKASEIIEIILSVIDNDIEYERSYPISKEMDECVNGFMETISEITH